MSELIDPSFITLAQLIALLCMILAWFAYRKTHPAKHNPLFRIERVIFDNKQEVYYCSIRRPFNQWRTIEIEKGVKGYKTFTQAELAMEGYLRNYGLEMTDTMVMKEYG